jgi:hypothetical protein
MIDTFGPNFVVALQGRSRSSSRFQFFLLDGSFSILGLSIQPP